MNFDITRFLHILLLVVALSACERNSRACSETGFILTNNEVFSIGLREAVGQGALHKSVANVEALLDQYPDCCYLETRGYWPDELGDWSEAYVSRISVYVPISDKSVPSWAVDSEHPFFKHTILISRCGEHRGSGGQPASENYLRSTEQSQYSVGAVEYEK